MTLTPAQTRLINEARNRERSQINFFGIPEKTKFKLIEMGLVETVPTLAEAEKELLRLETVQVCADLQSLVLDANCSFMTAHRAANKIQSNIRQLHATINVLTNTGRTIDI